MVDVPKYSARDPTHSVGSDYRRSSGAVTSVLESAAAHRQAASFPAELTEVSLRDLDYGSNPLVGQFGKGGAAEIDYRGLSGL